MAEQDRHGSATKQQVDAIWKDWELKSEVGRTGEVGGGWWSGSREGQTSVRESPGPLREFRETAAHGVRIAVRAARRARGVRGRAHVAHVGLVCLRSRARASSPGVQRIADRELDRGTAYRARELPSAGSRCGRRGRPSLAAAVFLATAWALNRCAWRSLRCPRVHFRVQLCQALHALVHLWLGLRTGSRPGGVFAVTGRWKRPVVAPAGRRAGGDVLGGGFDVFYALQDEASTLGAARVAGGAARADRAICGKLSHGWLWSRSSCSGRAGLGVAYYWAWRRAALIAWEHQLVSGRSVRLDAAFFTAMDCLDRRVPRRLVDRVL